MSAAASEVSPRRAPPRVSAEAVKTLDRLSASLIRDGRWREAAEVTRLLAHLRRTSPSVWVRLGACELRQGSSRPARQAFERALKLRAGWVRAELGRAEALLQEGKREAAETALRAVAARSDSGPFTLRAQALLENLRSRGGRR